MAMPLRSLFALLPLCAACAAPPTGGTTRAASQANADPPEIGLCGNTALSTTINPACGGIKVSNWPNEGANHVDIGTAVAYCTNPPSSGDHYPVWAAYGTYPTPVDNGYLGHNLEHGAVIVRYQCPDNLGPCAAIEAQLQAIIDQRPDPICVPLTGKSRFVLVPDPNLDVSVGAATWQWTYRANCVDAPSLLAFIDAHYDTAPESLCDDGDGPL